ncbi:hypothetical protein [Rhodoblastus sp.]
MSLFIEVCCKNASHRRRIRRGFGEGAMYDNQWKKFDIPLRIEG